LWVKREKILEANKNLQKSFQNLIEGFKPKIKRMQNLAAPKTIHISESGVGLLTHNTSEYEMGRLHRPESFVTPSNEAQ
jgi:hypothetical protein